MPRVTFLGRAQWKINQLPSLRKNKQAWKDGMGSLVVRLLAERARYECAHSTRALEDQPGYPVKKNKRAWKDHLEG